MKNIKNKLNIVNRIACIYIKYVKNFYLYCTVYYIMVYTHGVIICHNNHIIAFT